MTLPVENRECLWYNGKSDYFVLKWDIGHTKGKAADLPVYAIRQFINKQYAHMGEIGEQLMPLKYNISYEVASTIFLIILLFYINLQYDTNSELNKEFRKLTVCGLITTVLDVLSAITISFGGAVPVELNILLNTLYFFMVALLGYQVMYYVAYYVYRAGIKKSFIQFHQILICFYAMVLIVNIFTGFFFSFNRVGEYVKGPAHYFRCFFSRIFFWHFL